MGTDLQNAIDQENLANARHNLVEFTGRLKPSDVKVTDEVVDGWHLGFLRMDGNDLTFEEMLAIKKFADYIKSR